jgi:hypothetical protein
LSPDENRSSNNSLFNFNSNLSNNINENNTRSSYNVKIHTNNGMTNPNLNNNNLANNKNNTNSPTTINNNKIMRIIKGGSNKSDENNHFFSKMLKSGDKYDNLEAIKKLKINTKNLDKLQKEKYEQEMRMLDNDDFIISGVSNNNNLCNNINMNVNNNQNFNFDTLQGRKLVTPQKEKSGIWNIFSKILSK